MSGETPREEKENADARGAPARAALKMRRGRGIGLTSVRRERQRESTRGLAWQSGLVLLLAYTFEIAAHLPQTVQAADAIAPLPLFVV